MALTEELIKIDVLCEQWYKLNRCEKALMALNDIHELTSQARADHNRLADKLATAVEALDGARCFKSCPCVRCDEIDAALDKIKESSNG